MTSAHDANRFDLGRIQSETPVAEVRYFDRIDSTNNAALAMCQDIRSANSGFPSLIIAGTQTRGRGRGQNVWWSAGGALTFSLIVEPRVWNLAENRWPLLSLTAGLAVRHAISRTLPDHEVKLKWPNDVLLNGRKVAGILVEVGPLPRRLLVIGIGINVNNSFNAAPRELRTLATSLIDVAGMTHELTDILIRTINELDIQLGRLGRGDADLPADWQRCCALKGNSVTIEVGTTRTKGLCQGIDGDGALILLTEKGLARFYAGVVSHFE
ncbi:MAG: biotin--[acetyl-CoA-carboxylase] ligase [Gemmatales bacterium]|nr:MAG: biotin--[acetyl-CoA-carboxylase] ligase [Gemmatales bacterium]